MDKYRCYDLWTVRRLKSHHLSRKGWQEDANWSPCTFVYKEELQRVETFHYEQEVFTVIPEYVDEEEDDDEAESSVRWSNHEGRSFVSGGGGDSENEETDQVHDDDEPSLSSRGLGDVYKRQVKKNNRNQRVMSSRKKRPVTVE